VIHLDTSFVVDLQRDAGRAGAARAFLERHAGDPFGISVHALCELEAGVRLARNPQREHARLQAIISGLAVAYPDHRFADTYGRTFAALERRGKRVPAMDLLIAVAALADRAALVTRDTRDFAAVPDLEVLGY
jgi:tRNA(fMet)-specific endonuclease VapC